jgi:hypothetical protein
MMWNVETSSTVKEVWLVTPDLKPDVSDSVTGTLVGNNIRKGKKYVYFFPENLSDSSDLIARLRSNLGIVSPRSRTADRVMTVQVETIDFPVAPGTGNVVFYFKTDSRLSRGEAFKEIVFTQVSERGIFWQECKDAEADSMYGILRRKLQQRSRWG